MYFESISHQLRNVSNACEAAMLIKSGEALSYEAICWTSENGTFLAVSDSHIDDSSFAETAILMKDGEQYRQVESITVAWIDDVADLENYFSKSETDILDMGIVSLIIGEPTDQTANFECGCCGCGFVSSVKYQLTFDQDAGYGICTACEKYY
jgi:hypothetical protein